MESDPQKARVQPLPTTVSTLIGDDAVLLDMMSSTYFELNAVGARLWTLSQQGLTVGEMTARLLEEFEIPASRDVQADIALFVEELRSLGLVRVNPT
jgi:hypothetical protein